MKILETKAYKVIMGYVYGWGATAVIVGALFKILHLPGASLVLMIGMLVEAAIFFLSAFEPPMEHYDWARVFPVLGRNGAKLDEKGGNMPVSMPAFQGNGVVSSATAPAGTTNINLGLESEDLNKLKAGINRIAETADHFAGIVGDAPDVARKIAKVTDSFEELGESTQQMSKILQQSVEGISSGYDEVSKMLLESTQTLTAQIKGNCEKLANGMGESASKFNSLSQLMEEQYQQLKTNATDYSQQIAGMNKNIGALNALYELQMQETKTCLDSFRGMQGDMGEMLENVSLSLDSTKLFKQEAQQLANNVASLNSVYGNMLSVVNNN
ncbi:gliding motility protein GldL [Odoribacter sp. Z80]|uniref:type IX secretion system motor protein PorL/GldL n=1 Tax=Odoribacter sp. Z80 TaxID=2304575 RepID=UPI00137B1522|nr:gliding motility protein GldL [Odoribacter sp. Z80]NCE71718.1 gliding motility protein GldL [Odoribacter sp. Z80]